MIQLQNRKRVVSLIVTVALALLSSTCYSHSLKDSLYVAVCDGDITKTKKLLMRGANVNATDVRGYSLLMVAEACTAGPGRAELVELLIANGAVVNTQARDGLALIGWNVFNAVKALGKGAGFGFGFQDGGYNPGDIPGLTGPCPDGSCVVNIFANYSAWETAAWWAQQAASSGIAVARSLGNTAIRQLKAIANNELKVIRCFENNRFSAAVSYLTQGTRFHGVATFAAQSAEIVPALSVASDVPATIAKAGRTGIGGTTEPYASGINWAFRRIATGAATGTLTTIGGAATRTFAVTFAFTTGYNAVQGWACRFGLQR